MKITIPANIRWLLLLLVALLVTAITEVLVFRVSSSLLMPVLGSDINSIVWIAKSITAPFMGAAFVTTFWWLAPSNKNMAAVTSLLLAAIWGIALMTSGFSSRFIWLFVMGALGLVGAIAAFFVGRNRHIANLV